MVLRGKLFSPIFAFSIAFPVPTVEPQGASAWERGQVPSQVNKLDQGTRGQGVQSPAALELKGELELHIWEIISRQMQHFRELRSKQHYQCRPTHHRCTLGISWVLDICHLPL